MSLYFTKSHEWADVDGDIAAVGITDYAAGELGDVVYVELPEVGSAVKAGEKLCEVESTSSLRSLTNNIRVDIFSEHSAVPVVSFGSAVTHQLFLLSRQYSESLSR